MKPLPTLLTILVLALLPALFWMRSENKRLQDQAATSFAINRDYWRIIMENSHEQVEIRVRAFTAIKAAAAYGFLYCRTNGNYEALTNYMDEMGYANIYWTGKP